MSANKLSCLLCFTHYAICKVCILTITALWYHVIAWLLFSACEQWAFMLSCQMISFTKQASWWFIALVLQMFECLTSLTLIKSAMKLICMQCWLQIYCLATVKSKDYQKFEWYQSVAWWWSAVRWSCAEFSRSRRL